MDRIIRMGVKYWDVPSEQWCTLTWDMKPGRVIELKMYNLTFVQYSNAMAYIDIAGRSNEGSNPAFSPTSVAGLLSKVRIGCGEKDGWLFLNIGVSDGMTQECFKTQSIIMDSIDGRRQWGKAIRDNKLSMTDGLVTSPDLLSYQWMSDTGIIKRPPMAWMNDMSAGQYMTDNVGIQGYDTDDIRNSWYTMKDWIDPDLASGMGWRERMLGDIRIPENTWNISQYDEEGNEYLHEYNGVPLWSGPIHFPDSGWYSNQILSIRYADGFYKPNIYDPWGTRYPNTPGWFYPTNYGWMRYNHNTETPIPFYAPSNRDIDIYPWGCSASLFSVHAVDGWDGLAWDTPIMGAISQEHALKISPYLTSRLHLDLNGRPSDLTIYTTYGDRDNTYQIDWGNNETVPDFPYSKWGSIGIRACTMQRKEEGQEYWPALYNETEHAVDCLMVPSIYSDWPALDIYGLTNPRDYGGDYNPIDGFIWKMNSNFNSVIGPSDGEEGFDPDTGSIIPHNQWPNKSIAVNIHSTARDIPL